MPYYMFSPVTWGLLLAVLLLATWRRLPRGLRISGALAGALLLLACMPIGANAIEAGLEGMVPPAAHCTARDVGPVVMLSGGFDSVPHDLEDFGAFTLESWNRVRAATNLWHEQGRGVLWISGGGPYPIRESAMQSRLAADWGVPVAALRIETVSTNTWDSAQALRPALHGQRHDQRIRLVTSAWHRPRALFAFRVARLDACVQGDDSDVVRVAGLGAWMPQVSAIEKSENALYELAGNAAYRLRAWRAGRVVDAAHAADRADRSGQAGANGNSASYACSSSRPIASHP